jgi:hypothetical protein
MVLRLCSRIGNRLRVRVAAVTGTVVYYSTLQCSDSLPASPTRQVAHWQAPTRSPTRRPSECPSHSESHGGDWSSPGRHGHPRARVVIGTRSLRLGLELSPGLRLRFSITSSSTPRRQCQRQWPGQEHPVDPGPGPWSPIPCSLAERTSEARVPVTVTVRVTEPQHGDGGLRVLRLRLRTRVLLGTA